MTDRKNGEVSSLEKILYNDFDSTRVKFEEFIGSSLIFVKRLWEKMASCIR
jgi:hypothetical protein